LGRATAEDWTRYYASAAQRRRDIGGDPLRTYLERKIKQQRVMFIGSSLFLVGLFTVLYSVLNG
jgi:hypothetical protein